MHSQGAPLWGAHASHVCGRGPPPHPQAGTGVPPAPMPFGSTLRVPQLVFASLMYYLTACALTVPHNPRFPIIRHSPSGRCAGVSPRIHDVTLPRIMWDGEEREIATCAHVPLATFKTNLSSVQDQPPWGLISPCTGFLIAVLLT